MTEFTELMERLRALYAHSDHAGKWHLTLRQSANAPGVTWELRVGEQVFCAETSRRLIAFAALALSMEPL